MVANDAANRSNNATKSANPDNKDTSVISKAPGNPIAPVSQPVNRNGGQGIVGGPYGVQITTDKQNAYGESQTREGGGRGIVGGPYGVILQGSQSNDYNAKASDYSKSLINNAGLVEGSPQYNTAFQNYLQANKLEQVKDSGPSNRDDNPKPSSFSENYGYSGGVKVSPIISQNFDKNPLETNYELEKTKSAIQARNSFKSIFSSDQGGVQTKQSEGKSFGYGWANKQSESIGSKIFSNQEQLTRNTVKEEQVKQSEAERAFTSSQKINNKDYTSGGTKDVDSVVTLGKAQQVFGNKTAFGWNDVSKDQLQRDSIQEKALNTTLGARSTFKEGVGTPFSVGLTDKSQTKNASDVFFSSQSTKSQSPIVASKPQEQTQDFNSFFSGAESRGSIINIYNAQGARVGSVKADEQGKQTLESLGDSQGVYFRESKGGATYDSAQRRSFADFVSKEGGKGTVIDIFSGGQKVGQVSGPNAYRDTIGLQTKYGSISGQVDYSTTPEGKSLLDVVSKGGIVSFSTQEKGSIGLIYSGDKNAKTTLNNIVSNAPNGFNYQILYPDKEKALLDSIQNNPAYFEKQPQSFWDNAYRTGSLQPNDSAQINSIFQSYNREQNAQAKTQQKANASYMSNLEYPGNTFVIKDESGKVVGTTSGQRSRYDFLKSEGYGTKSPDIGPYTSNTVTPKYNGTISQGIQAVMESKAEPKDIGGILTDIGKSAASTGAGMVGLGLSALGYGKGTINDLNLSQRLQGKEGNTTSQNYNKFKEDISYFVTGGYKLGGLVQGRIEQKDNPSMTQRGESIVSAFPAPTASRGYVNAGTGIFTGAMIGATAYGARGLAPLRFESIPLKIVKTPEASPAFPNIEYLPEEKTMVSGSLVFGYGRAGFTSKGEVTFGGRELITETASGFRFGRTKPNDIFPENYQIAAKATRGEEFATGKPYGVSKLTSHDFLQYAESTGRLYPGTTKALDMFKDIKNTIRTTGEYTNYEGVQPTTTSKVTSGVGKAVLEQNAKNSSFFGKFNFLTGWAVKQGSTVAYEHTHPSIRPEVYEEFPVGDLDLRVGNPVAGSGGRELFGLIDLSARQAKKQAELGQRAIVREQGIEQNTGNLGIFARFKAKLFPLSTSEKSQLLDFVAKESKTRKFYTGGSFSLSKAIIKGEKRNPNDVEQYFTSTSNIRTDKSIIDKSGLFLTNIAKDYFKSIGRNPEEIGFRSHPVKATNNFIGTVFNKVTGESYVDIVPRPVEEHDVVVDINGYAARSPLQVMHDKYRIVNEYEEALNKNQNPHKDVKHYDKALIDIENWENAEKNNNIISGSPLSGFGKVDLKPHNEVEADLLGKFTNKQITEQSGSKIIDAKTGQKLIEYTTERDTQDEKPSSMKPQGWALGEEINYHVYKTPIAGSDLKGPEFGGQHTEQSYIAQIFAFQNTGTLAEQGASPEFANRIGNYVFVGPKAFGEGKELARVFGLFKSKAVELKSNPKTYLQGAKIDAQVALLKEFYGPLYDVDFGNTKVISGADYSPPSGYWKSGKSPSYSSTISKIGLFSNSKTNTNQSSFNPNNSQISKSRNSLTGSSVSIFSGKSVISNISNLSGKSGISGKSNLSAFSGTSSQSSRSSRSSQSGRSGISSLSGKSGPSGRSAPSGPSAFSAFSGTSGPSGPSSPSGPSGPSGTSGISAFSGTSGTSGFSGFNSISSPPNFPPYIKIGNTGKRKNTKTKSGPTGLIQLNVHNIFASSLDIEVPRNRRVLF